MHNRQDFKPGITREIVNNNGTRDPSETVVFDALGLLAENVLYEWVQGLLVRQKGHRRWLPGAEVPVHLFPWRCKMGPIRLVLAVLQVLFL